MAADQPADPKPEARVDVVVRDRHGRIARDLEASDFAIAEGDAKLAVKEVRLVEGGAGAPRLVSLIFQKMPWGEPAEIFTGRRAGHCRRGARQHRFRRFRSR